MKIALVGYGKMGRLVERVAVSRGHEVVARFDTGNNARATGLNAESLAGTEVAIEFTTPAAAPANLRRLLEIGLPVVTGTTGWYAELDEIKELVAARSGALVYGANFSIGMNLFFRIVGEAARLFANYEDYDPFLVEHHHKFKKDAPSGTALQIARLMSEAYGERMPAPVSVRAGYIPGTHEVGFDGEAETVTLTHTARSREGFAAGAVLAAEMIGETSGGRRGCFEFSQLLFSREEAR